MNSGGGAAAPAAAANNNNNNNMTVSGGGGGGQFGDTTYTKVFVGGLAWETHKETMKKYFEQFGDILEAVVITDKSTGRSKGYGFVCYFISSIPFFALLTLLSFLSFFFFFKKKKYISCHGFYYSV